MEVAIKLLSVASYFDVELHIDHRISDKLIISTNKITSLMRIDFRGKWSGYSLIPNPKQFNLME